MLVAQVVVRRIRPGDAAVLRRVRLRALEEDPASFGSTYGREVAFDDAVWRERAARDASGQTSATLLALRGEEPVGIVTGVRDDADTHTFHVFAMWVAPEVRREGVASRLLDAIERWIASSGGMLVRLSVTNQAPAAQRLYETAGYEPDGEAVESRHTPGLIELGMRKRLAG